MARDNLTVLTGVGQNLQDHLDSVLSCTSKDKNLFGIGLGALVTQIGQFLQWRRDGTGLLSTPFAEGWAFFKASPEVDCPDLQLHFCISVVDDHARKLPALAHYRNKAADLILGR